MGGMGHREKERRNRESKWGGQAVRKGILTPSPAHAVNEESHCLVGRRSQRSRGRKVLSMVGQLGSQHAYGRALAVQAFITTHPLSVLWLAATA